MMNNRNKLIAVLAAVVCLAAPALAQDPDFPAVPGHRFRIPKESTQLVLGLAKGWDDSHVVLQRWQFQGTDWVTVGDRFPGRTGKNGLAWGRGLHPINMPGAYKKEGDARAPAGVFKIGNAFGYAPKLLCHPDLVYHRVTEQDMWVEDPESEFYNQHRQLPGRGPQTEWERKQQMRLGDYAHSLKLFIEHNTAPNTLPGAGSAIFFHIWREDGRKPAWGCTTMAEDDLRRMISWVDPNQKPIYVLLPIDVYDQVKVAWGLPF
jgi:L,D-peptidoglycan transpeptidase YkuD (ErfK/YbiS/YcfS/YnhG family)